MHVKTVQGVEVPALGYGTFQLSGSQCERGVAHALSVGYRHLDTAQAYENEDRVGAAIAASGVPREEIFLTTKLWTSELTRDRVGPATDASLRRLGTDQVDLLLIHWPSPEVPLGETLAAMVAVMDAGRTRSIGLSNFPPSLVREALEHAPILCNQVEYHPFLGQPRLRELAAEHDLLLTAYSPLARGRVDGDDTLREIAAAHGATPAQVALRWLVDQDRVAAIPKATSPERIEENLGALEPRLDDAERRRIDALERGERLIAPTFAPDWED
jgi:2,5-diketo-D-gluconate reductase B